MRSWKQYYTVLSGPLLNFYKDKKDFQQVQTSYLDSAYMALPSSVQLLYKHAQLAITCIIRDIQPSESKLIYKTGPESDYNL